MKDNDLFDLKFDKTENCWNIMHYYGSNEEVILPGSYKGKPVKKIGDEFSPYNKRIKRITIPEGYTSIGALAFQNCTKLTEIKLPESLTSIGALAFAGCTGLTNIKLPKNLTSIEAGVFENCKRLANIKLPESLTSIGELAFAGCTGLTNIKLPKNLTSIGGEVFLDCTGLTKITVDKNNSAFRSVDGAIFDKTMTTLILAPVGRKGFYSIPEGIQYIGDYAFSGCKRLVNIVLPDSISFIGDSAFARCERLKTITLSNKLRYAIEYVIRDLTGLQDISHSGNPEIGRRAFEGFKGRFVYRD